VDPEATMKKLATVLLMVTVAGCGGSDSPKRTLAPGTLTVGAVVASLRDRPIADAARLGAGEVNDAGGIHGKLRLRVVAGPDARKLAREGASVFILPCEPGDEGRALGAVRGLRVLTFATCNDEPVVGAGAQTLTAPWGVGPDVDDRAAMLAAGLHDRDVTRIALVPGGAADVIRKAAAAWGIQVTLRQPEAIATDGDWAIVDRLRGRSVYGLDRLDTSRGIRAAGADAEGRSFATFGFPVPGSELDELYERYRLAYGARPDGSQAQLGYDAIRVLTEAVEKARSRDPVAVAGALPGLEVSGAGGVLNYPDDGSRRPRADAALVEVRNGRLDLVKRGRPELP
jgi:branched-chain amino acid transport system substrate-binding protein